MGGIINSLPNISNTIKASFDLRNAALTTTAPVYSNPRTEILMRNSVPITAYCAQQDLVMSYVIPYYTLVGTLHNGDTFHDSYGSSGRITSFNGTTITADLIIDAGSFANAKQITTSAGATFYPAVFRMFNISAITGTFIIGEQISDGTNTGIVTAFNATGKTISYYYNNSAKPTGAITGGTSGATATVDPNSARVVYPYISIENFGINFGASIDNQFGQPYFIAGFLLNFGQVSGDQISTNEMSNPYNQSLTQANVSVDNSRFYLTAAGYCNSITSGKIDVWVNFLEIENYP